MLTGRFAPSPSGRMHLGNVFSALLAWLSVRSRGGRMLLRIEDLDPDRCRPEYAETLKRDLDWLGLDWDAEQTPQSRRTEAYRAEFDKLAALGLVYPCYCSRAELHAASAPHASDGTVVYAGTCRDLTPEQRAVKTRAPAWRVRVPDERITVHDGLQGLWQEDLARDCGDFIIRRSDGDLDLGALRQRLSPQELLGQLAYLAGLQPEPAPATAAELASRFSWDLVVSDNIVIHSEFT